MSAKNHEEVILEILVKSEGALRAIGDHQVAIENLKAKQAEYREELKKEGVDKEAYRKSINETTQAIKYEQDAVRILSKEVQNNIKHEDAAIDSIDEMKASLSRLTAQYNALSSSDRNGDIGTNLKTNIVSIDAALKSEEQSLGNFRRQVGNYEVATKSMRGELRTLTEQIGQMKLAGKEGSDEYIAIAKRASEVKDAFGDAAREINVGASDTKGLDRLKGATDALSGTFTMLNSVQGMFTDDQEEMAKLTQKVQVGIGALTAGIALQNALQKEGIIMNTIEIAQKKAKTAATKLETSTTIGAATAQKVLNAVANANPYMLLFTALITVVGALALFALGSETAAEKQEKLNKSSAASLDTLELYGQQIKDKHQATIKAAQDELDMATAQGKSGQELEPLYQKLHRAKMAMYSETKGFFGSEVADIQKNKAELVSLEEQIAKLKQQIADGNGDEKTTITVNGKVMTDDAEDLIDTLQGAIDNTKRKVTIGVAAKTEQEDEQKKEILRAAANKKEAVNKAASNAKDARKKEQDAIRAAEDSIIAILKEGQEKEVRTVNEKYKRQIEDLKTKFKEEQNLTVTARQKINETIANLEKAQTQELDKISESYSAERFAKSVEQQRMLIETRLLAVKEGSDAEHQLEMTALNLSLEEELQANAAKEERLRMDEQLIRDKYRAQADVVDKERDDKLRESMVSEAQFAMENKFLQAQMNGENELQAKLDLKQAEIAALTQMDEEGDEAFLNRKLQMAAEEKAIIKDIADTKRQETSDMLAAVGGAFGAMSSLMGDMAEDNAALATFSKVLALFEIGLNTASAFAAIPAMAAKGDPYTYAIRVAVAITTALGAIGQAYSVLNKQKQPKAPKLNKYATGGMVHGAGSGTSDSVPAMLSAGESVMTAFSTAMFAPILSSFNQIGGGVPIQVHNSSAQVMGEDMLARAFARGAAALPAPILDIQELANHQQRLVIIEQLRNM